MNRQPTLYRDTTNVSRVLLVEADRDFRIALKCSLQESFHVIEAIDGIEGWQKALNMHPSLVVAAVSLPVLDGKGLCAKLKYDERTAHIPVILLTGVHGGEEELSCLGSGANDYISQPFNMEILLSKIKNLLSLQANFRRTYMRRLELDCREPDGLLRDELFLKFVVDYISENIQNSALSVYGLSRRMAMNRNTLYKKVLALTGRSPVAFIRYIRLKKAAYLLANSQLNISEVGYEVGFNTPQYFAKSFKEEYNMVPSQFIMSARLQPSRKVP